MGDDAPLVGGGAAAAAGSTGSGTTIPPAPPSPASTAAVNVAASKADLEEVKTQLQALFTLVRGDGAAAAQQSHQGSAPKAPGRLARESGGDLDDDDDPPDDIYSTVGSSDAGDSILGGMGDGRGDRSIAARAARPTKVVLHPDGFDDPDLPDAHDIIRAYDIPPAVQRRDGIPVPIEPDDARFHAHFKHGSAGYHEAAFPYQVAAWA